MSSGQTKKVSAQKRLSLWPREHGAYAQISFPLLTALALGGLGLAPLLLIIAAVSLFLAHEPFMVLIGGRGGRTLREGWSAARKRLAMLLGIAGTSGLIGLVAAPPVARIGALLPLGLAGLLTPLIFSRKERTTVGELLVAGVLSTTLVPVALAAGVAVGPALIAAGVWAIAFALGTITVRSLIRRAKRDAAPLWSVVLAPALSAAVIAGALALALVGDFPVLAALAVIPTAAVALVFGLAGVHPRNLRRMGWSLVASNVAVLAALVLGLA